MKHRSFAPLTALSRATTAACPGSAALVLACALLLGACGSSGANSPGAADPSADEAAATAAPAHTAADPIAAAVNAPRDPRDTDRDEIRKPEPLLRFFAVAPGMRVADIGSGPGYTGSLLARVVGPEGKVYAQNPAPWGQFSWPAWRERQANGRMANVEIIERPWDDPLPPEATDLDMVFSILVYHDAVNMKADPAKMNQAIFQALKPGGVYAVVDHHAAEGAGSSEVGSLHRIEKSLVVSEIEAAGFTLVKEGDFLRDPSDDRTGKAWANPQPVTDRFVLMFQKPE